MRFSPLKSQAPDNAALAADYRNGRKIGVVCLGEHNLFFRKFTKTYYIAYEEMERCFRRVMVVPTKCCCGKGTLQVEHLVVCSDGRELAVVQLPGTRAAESLMADLARVAPQVKQGKE